MCGYFGNFANECGIVAEGRCGLWGSGRWAAVGARGCAWVRVGTRVWVGAARTRGCPVYLLFPLFLALRVRIRTRANPGTRSAR